VCNSKFGEVSLVVLSNAEATLEARDYCRSFCKQAIITSFSFKSAKKMLIEKNDFFLHLIKAGGPSINLSLLLLH